MGITRISFLISLSVGLTWLNPTRAHALPGAVTLSTLPTQKMDASCADMEVDLSKMESVRQTSPSKTRITLDRLHDAIELLQSREFPDEVGVRLSAIALHENFETVFPHYAALGNVDCPKLRLRLGRDLIASYIDLSQPIRTSHMNTVTEESVDHKKSEISAAIQSMLTESKYPQPIEALSDALILREALKEGLIRGSPGQLRELTLLTDQLPRDVHDFLSDANSSAPGDSWERAARILQSYNKTKPKNLSPNQAAQVDPQVEFLKVDSQIQKLKPNLLKEIEASAKYLAHVRALILRLNNKLS